MDMVTRVAMAIASSQLDEGDSLYDWYALTEEVQDDFLATARAAIEAMRHPDHDMTARVLRPGEDRTFLVSLWERMIDGALDKPEPVAALSPSGEK